jgi:hypothetical protein
MRHLSFMDGEVMRVTARNDLLISETSAEALKHQVTKRAEIFLSSGALSFDDVLDTLKISRATWYRRLEAFRAWEEKGGEA